MLVLDNRDVSIWGDQQFNEIKLFLPLQQTINPLIGWPIGKHIIYHCLPTIYNGHWLLDEMLLKLLQGISHPWQNGITSCYMVLLTKRYSKKKYDALLNKDTKSVPNPIRSHSQFLLSDNQILSFSINHSQTIGGPKKIAALGALWSSSTPTIPVCLRPLIHLNGFPLVVLLSSWMRKVHVKGKKGFEKRR